MISDRDMNEIGPDLALSHALDLCYALRLKEAESALEAILLDSQPDYDAYSALALIKLMQGQPDQQRGILEDALTRNPGHYPSLHQLALVHYRAGRLDEAYSFIQRALSQKPDSERSLLLAARLSLNLGNFQEACQLAEQVLQSNDGWHVQACLLMSEALIQGRETDDLCQELVEAITAGRGDAVILRAACQLIADQQTEEQHLQLCEQKLGDDPDNTYLRLLRIKLLGALGRHDDRFPDLYYLLSIEPDNLTVLHNLAESLLLLKRHRESLQVYLRIARINGTDPQLLNQIGVCYRSIARFRSAEKAYWRSIRINPFDTLIIGNLGEVKFRFGDFKRSLELYSIALSINPISKEIFFNKMLAYSVGSPEGLAAMRADAAAYWSIYRMAHAITEPSLPGGERSIGEASATLSAAHPPKVRMGFLTSDVGNHCVSYFLSSYLRNYSRDRFNVELILCDRRYEEREREICGYVDHALSLEGLDEHKSRELIRDRHYDLIIECNGYTGGSGISLLAERCAPVQCHYIGYHASTGLDTIDYFISDAHILSPSVSEQLTEKPLKLDRAWLAFAAFDAFPQAKSVATVTQPLLGFFGNSTKITDLTLEYWSALFAECSQAILVLKCLTYQDPYIAESVVRRIECCGIDRSRIAIIEPTASWVAHMDYYNLVDYALDSTPWSSATTGFDALGMGVPLLAIQGDTIASRMSSSLVSHLGRVEWIATSPSDYGRFGQSIEREFIEVRSQKGALQKEVQNSSLFDGSSLARSLEEALLSAMVSVRS
jgi:protein O-GlcNAc transferase